MSTLICEKQKVSEKSLQSLCDALEELEIGEEIVWWNGDEPFIVARATDDDLERIGRGMFCID